MRERAAEQLRTDLRESMLADGYSEELVAELEAFIKERGAEMNEKAIREGRVKARRIQLRRTAGWRMPPNTVKVDRSTDYGNPYRVVKVGKAQWTVEGPGSAVTMGTAVFATKAEATAHAVERFRVWVTGASGWSAAARYRARVMENLPGRNLACWCAEGTPCHGTVLIELAAGRLAVSGE